ncbi:MAG: NADH-quinone oxidoreductase subunit NuoH [Pseudomonadota bacterium]
MRTQKSKLAKLAELVELAAVAVPVALAAIAGCTPAPAEQSIRDIRPTTLEIDEKMLIETRTELEALAPCQVHLDGEIATPGKAPVRRKLVIDGARATAPAGASTSTRVLVDIDSKLEAQLGGHAVFNGRVEVYQRDLGRAARDNVRLDFFPATLRAASVAVAAGPALSWMPDAIVCLLMVLLAAVPLLVVAALGAALIIVAERKISGRMQSRLGPNRVGPNGWGQFVADAVKFLLKEDLVPREADPWLFRLSPYLVFMGVFATFLVVPFSPVAVVADLEVGILYLLSVTSLVVVGIIMGGWASNSKWSLLGGMRSAAQIISYELPAAVSVLAVVALAGTLSTQGLVANQGGWPWEWHLFDNPLTFACFFIYFASALAEGNRTPFDLPEAESELVAGYTTEYSGFRFAAYFIAEWVNLIVIGAVTTTLFLGGWQLPLVSPLAIEASTWLHVASLVVFGIKTVFVVFVIVWLRWTLPRFRIDQMMALCWKYFLPIALFALVVVATWVWLAPPWLRLAMRYATAAVCGGGILFFFLARVRYTSRTTRVIALRGA